MAQDRHAILSEAVARGLPVTLAVPDAGQRRTVQSRFLINGEQGVWVEVAAADSGLVNSLIEEAAPIEVAVRVDREELSFIASVLRFEPELQLNEGLALPAMLLATPAEIHSKQRRMTYRVNVGNDGDVTFRIWRISDKADVASEPVKAAEFPAVLRNLSAGGAGCLIKPAAGGPQPVTGLRLRVQIKYESVDLVIAGRLTWWPANRANDTGASVGLPAGIRFEGLEADFEGRQAAAALTRVISQLQRRELRRNRLGAA